MMELLKKEFALCMHPTGYIMLAAPLLVLVPGYPYAVTCFYMGLAIYFICLAARENHDTAYTLTLPVSRENAVLARILMCCILEMAQLALIGVMILAKNAIGMVPNPAGIDAGVALVGDALVTFAVFNLVYFPLYYRDINKPGKAFLAASAAVFAWIILGVVGTYTISFFRDVLDRPDPACMRDKLLFDLGALALFIAGTALAARNSVRKFEKTDLQL